MNTKFYYIVFSLFFLMACNSPTDIVDSKELPPIYPDYTDITIPYNIAPLNFLMRNEPQAVEVSVKGKSSSFLVYGSSKIQFPENKWRSFLEDEKGKTISVQVTAKVKGKWIRYASFKWKVVLDKIDSYLSYSRIEPGSEVGNRMQLCQRNLENFSETILADNSLAEGSYMDCHIYSQHQRNTSLFCFKGKDEGLVLNRNGDLRKLYIKNKNSFASASYGDFHSSGRFVVFSQNAILLKCHTYRDKREEIYDTESDLEIMDFDSNKIIRSPLVYGKGTLETFPVFSADGKSIYYCSAPRVALPDSIRILRYSLMKIGFDPDRGTFGNKINMVLSADSLRQSISFPKVSPNGRYLMFCVSDYGTYPVWHKETDLRMLDLITGKLDSLKQVNANYSDAYHSWSSNSKWFVFASMRDDGIYSKPYFSYIDKNGESSKPFVLPQEDPAYYDYSLILFNMPELSKEGVSFGAMDIERLFQKQTKKMK